MVERRKDWCILTTAGPRTLALAKSLTDAGMRAWTPVRTERRTGRGKRRKEVVMLDVALTPTFVFVAAEHIPELLRARDLPACPFPAYRVLKHRDMIPAISDASLEPLRATEQRFRQSLLKTIRRRVAPGTAVRMHKGAFAGMTGVVEDSSDKDARVNFGSGFVVTIASYLIETNVVRDDEQPALGLAA